MHVIDFHTHAFPDALAPAAVSKLAESCKEVGLHAHHDGTIAGLEKAMDRAGIDCAVVSSIATKPSQNKAILEWNAALLRNEENRSGGPRLFPFPSVHPASEDLETALDRVVALGFRGIKLHPYYQAAPLDSPAAFRLARLAAERNLILLCHCGYDAAFDPEPYCTPLQVRRLVEGTEGLKFVAAHLGGWKDWDEVRKYLLGRPIWLDTSFSLEYLPRDAALELLASHPADRLLFGSDSPWGDQAEALSLLTSYERDLGSGWLEGAAGANARTLLGPSS